MNIEVQGLLNEQDLLAIGEQLEPDTSAALLVWENVWARSVAQKIRDAGGVLVAFERVPHETLCRQHANGCSKRPSEDVHSELVATTNRRTQMRRGIGRRGPGLIGTAVVVGGAAHMGAASAQRSQAAAQQEAAQNAQILNRLSRTARHQAPAAARLRRPRATTWRSSRSIRR